MRMKLSVARSAATSRLALLVAGPAAIRERCGAGPGVERRRSAAALAERSAGTAGHRAAVRTTIGAPGAARLVAVGRARIEIGEVIHLRLDVARVDRSRVED